MADKPIDIYRRLVDRSSSYLYDDVRNVESKLTRCHYEGKEIPDDLLPGRVVMGLTPEQRAILSQLTSDEVSKERLSYAVWCMKAKVPGDYGYKY
jgi:hypothetical protein